MYRAGLPDTARSVQEPCLGKLWASDRVVSGTYFTRTIPRNSAVGPVAIFKWFAAMSESKSRGFQLFIAACVPLSAASFLPGSARRSFPFDSLDLTASSPATCAPRSARQPPFASSMRGRLRPLSWRSHSRLCISAACVPVHVMLSLTCRKCRKRERSGGHEDSPVWRPAMRVVTSPSMTPTFWKPKSYAGSAGLCMTRK